MLFRSGEWPVWSDFNKSNEQALHKAELLSGLPTLILLFIAFGSAIAAGLPLILAIAGIAVGFGALHLAMRAPGVFQAAASISGDCAFEYCYGPDLLACCRGLAPFGGDPAAFLALVEEHFRAQAERKGIVFQCSLEDLPPRVPMDPIDRKSTRLNSSH